MTRIRTFDTHEFAARVLANLECPACTTLSRQMIEHICASMNFNDRPMRAY